MSKSLKNFVSIREMLEQFTTRQVRLFFALQTWYSKMHYTDETLLEAVAKEKQLQVNNKKKTFTQSEDLIKNIPFDRVLGSVLVGSRRFYVGSRQIVTHNSLKSMARNNDHPRHQPVFG